MKKFPHRTMLDKIITRKSQKLLTLPVAYEQNT